VGRQEIVLRSKIIIQILIEDGGQMTTHKLLEKWQCLDSEQRQQVLDFIDSIHPTKKLTQPSSRLGEKLRKIRREIIESGIPLLTPEEIQLEKAERRGGYVDE